MNNNDFSENKTTFASEAEATEFLLQDLHGCFKTEDIIEGKQIRLPEWNISVIPFVSEIKEQIANTGYYI